TSSPNPTYSTTVLLFFLMLPHHPLSTLFPYTTLFRSVLSIARSPNAGDSLPHLVVVTFTNRAADEMQQRTRQALLEENLRQEVRSEEHTSELQSRGHLVCRLLLEKKNLRDIDLKLHHI